MSKRSLIERFIAWLSRGAQDTSELDRLCAAYNSGDFVEAYRLVREIMARYPALSENGDVCVLRAELELATENNVDKAQHLLDRAQELGCADIGDYYRVHGEAMWKAGDLQKAVRDYEQSVAIDPRAASLMMLAQALSASDDARATSVWERFLQEEPAHCGAHVNLAWESIKCGDSGKALLLTKRAEKLAQSADNLFGVGRLYQEMAQYEAAIDAYLEADRRGYANKGLLYACLAICHFCLGEAKPARTYAEWARRHDPDDEYVNEVWRECQKEI